VPIILSHGLTGSRALYSTAGRELASHGYIVFILDHHDGSCAYTEDSTGTKTWWFDKDAPFFDYDDMNKKVKIREEEVKALIDEISVKTFMKNILQFEAVSLDLNKLIMAGHSMGGATALRIANSEPRAKCVLTHDPWLLPINREIH
jgi:predicted dienelactone hydrolase